MDYGKHNLLQSVCDSVSVSLWYRLYTRLSW